MQAKKIKLGTVMKYVLLISVALLIAYPFIWMVVTAFKPEADIRSFPPTLFTDNYTLDNFKNIWERIPFLAYYKNTIIFAGSVTW